jgi:CTD kinase subunit beta
LPTYTHSPRATIASAQTLYHRFHLFFPWKDFNYHVRSCPSFTLSSSHSLAFSLAKKDVALASLYASTKMHDTLKKPRDILMVSYAVRFPELAAKSKNAGGEVDMDPTVRFTSSPLNRRVLS